MSARPISIETATGQEHVLQALNHERSILGTWMAAPATIDEVSTLLGDEDFTIEKHRRIRRQIITLHERGEAVTAHAVAQALLEAGKLLDGELGYITGLAAPSGDYVLPQGAGIITSYARTLRSLTMRRLVIRETDRLRSEAFNGCDSEEISASLQRAAELLTSRTLSAQSLLGPTAIYERDFRSWKDFTGHETRPGAPLPWPEPIGCLRIGEYTILAGRPGDGKSAAAGNIALYAAKQFHRVYIVTLEMKGGTILRRMVASEANVSQWKLANGLANESEERAAYAALSAICDLPILMQDRHAGTGVEQIRNALRAALARDECPTLVIIDYLQLLHGGGGQNRNEEIGRISRGLKSLTLDFPIALLALSQLSRDSEKEGKREPRLSDLRDSGSLEQDADNVVFLHAGSDDVNAKVREVRWIVRKQRNGHVGAVPLWFHRDQLRFTADGGSLS